MVEHAQFEGLHVGVGVNLGEFTARSETNDRVREARSGLKRSGSMSPDRWALSSVPTDAGHARDEGPAEMVLPQADRALRCVAVAAMVANMCTAGWHALDMAGWSTQFVVSLFGGGLSMAIGAALAARVGCRAGAGGARW